MFLLKPLFDCFCWSAARLPHSTSCCRGRCSIASLDRLLLALVLKHACAEALAVQSLSIPNRWVVPSITADSAPLSLAFSLHVGGVAVDGPGRERDVVYWYSYSNLCTMCNLCARARARARARTESSRLRAASSLLLLDAAGCVLTASPLQPSPCRWSP